MSRGGAYRIELKPSALAALKALPEKDRRRVSLKINALTAIPRPPKCEKIAGAEDTYRLRSGDYRIIYQISDQALLVLVVRIAHRRDVYRNL